MSEPVGGPGKKENDYQIGLSNIEELRLSKKPIDKYNEDNITTLENKFVSMLKTRLAHKNAECCALCIFSGVESLDGKAMLCKRNPDVPFRTATYNVCNKFQEEEKT